MELLENKKRIVFPVFFFLGMVPLAGWGKEGSLLKLKSLSLSGGFWHSSTHRGYETADENFVTLPNLRVLLAVSKVYLGCGVGAQWVTLERSIGSFGEDFSAKSVDCDVSGGRSLRWKTGISLPLYQSNEPISEPYLGTGNLFVNLGVGYKLPAVLGTVGGAVPRGKLGWQAGADVAVNEEMIKPGSFALSSSLGWTTSMSRVKTGLSIGYDYKLWRWSTTGAGEETNHNLTLSLPLGIQMFKGHSLKAYGGWLAWNHNRREANNGFVAEPDISGYFLGGGWEYWL